MIQPSTCYGLVNKDSGQIIFKGSLKRCRWERRDGVKIVATMQPLGAYLEGLHMEAL